MSISYYMHTNTPTDIHMYIYTHNTHIHIVCTQHAYTGLLFHEEIR